MLKCQTKGVSPSAVFTTNRGPYPSILALCRAFYILSHRVIDDECKKTHDALQRAGGTVTIHTCLTPFIPQPISKGVHFEISRFFVNLINLRFFTCQRRA